jgi:hypothetical protein
MARARNIKPAFFKNYELADLGPVAQLLFAGLWCLADRDGRLEDKPRFIKAELFPYYECDVNGELTELQRLGFVRRYTVGGVDVIEVLNFKKHQTPHNTEKASTLPAFEAQTPRKPAPMLVNGEPTVNPPKHNDGKTPDSLIPDSLKEKEKTPRKRVDPPSGISRPETVTEQTWVDWLSLRKTKKAPVTETVLRGAMEQAEKAGMTLEEFLRVWCRRGSQGLEAEWIKPNDRGGTSPSQHSAFAGAI